MSNTHWSTVAHRAQVAPDTVIIYKVPAVHVPHMRLRNLVGATVAAGATVFAANRALRAEDLDPPLGRPTDTYRWRGFDIAYTEAGDPEDPDLLLFHGINATASSHEFRYVIEDLAEEFHVLAPDLPGFGRSDRPALLYSGTLYTDFVADFARDLTDDAGCVASSLTATYAVVAAREVSFRELVLVCPVASTMPERRVWVRSLLRSPVVGEALFNLLVSKPAIRYFLHDHGFANPRRVTDEWVEYNWATAHQPGARYAPASFMGGFLDLDVDLPAALAEVDEPVTLVWGRAADITPLSRGRELAERADARLVAMDDADLMPHAEHPDEFVDVVHGWLPKPEHEQ